MSTIASGVLGLVQGQAPAKGKAGHGMAAGTSEKGDFATTIANLHAKDGDGGRKGARHSISGTAHAEPETSQATDGRTKAAVRDMPALAEALRAAADAVKDEKALVGGKAPFGEKTAVLADAAERLGRKAHAEGRDGTQAATKVGKPEKDEADDAEGANTGKTAAGETDVGNLLELLAAPVAASAAATSQAGAVAAAALQGMVQDVKAQPGGKAVLRTEGNGARTDGQTGKADAAQTSHGDAVEAGDLPQSETDQLFRLIRADGKGRDLDISISGTGERATFRDANPTGPKGEAVTVVDARRYIGLAQAGNGAAVTTAITQDPEWAASLSATGGLTHADAAATGKVVNTLKIQMHPIELGLVTATLRLQGDDLVVSLQVETGEAYRQLTDDQDAIVRALRGQGFAVDQVSVQLAPTDRSSGSQQGDGQGQQAQQQFSSPQQQAREGGNGSGRGNGEGAGSFGREGRSHEGNTSENASGLAGGQSVRSGGVYL
ncbi:UNVERIFIED_ORG: flagellar hook-length control protein FliK [Roseateles sp. XES5]|nr:flagellar hook-length control protein FliK [Roseateles sp. XES5]